MPLKFIDQKLHRNELHADFMNHLQETSLTRFVEPLVMNSSCDFSRNILEHICKFFIGNPSFVSKLESQKLARELSSCFILFGTLQHYAPAKSGGNRTCDFTVRIQVSNRCVTSACSRLRISTSPVNNTALITLYCLVCCFHTRNLVGP